VEKKMTGPEEKNPVVTAVQRALGDYHRQIEEIDVELSRLVHRKEEIVAGARLSLLSQLPEEVRSQLPVILSAERPKVLGLPTSDQITALSAVVPNELESLRETLHDYYPEVQDIDARLAQQVHKREELIAAARISLVEQVSEGVKGSNMADFVPRVAMAILCL
jgi:hypothetical protein